MTQDRVEIGESMPNEQRNPAGWVLLISLAAFLIISQLFGYFLRTPNSEVQVTKVEQQFKMLLSAASLPGGSKNSSEMRQLAKDLEPQLADAKVAALYAALETEAGQEVQRKDLVSLRAGKNPANRAIYEIYTRRELTEDEAVGLVAKLPREGFLNRLIRVHALEKAKVSNTGREALTGGNSWTRLGVAGIMVCGGFLLGLAALIGYFVARAQGLLAPKGFPTGDVSLADADRLVMRSAQIFVSFIGLSLIGGLLLRGVKDSPFAPLPLYLAVLGMVVLLAKVPVWGKWISLRALGVSREKFGVHALWGVGAAIANIPILLVVTVVSTNLMKGLPAPEHPTTVELTTTSDPWVIVMSVVMAAIMAPIIEEIMFRGTMFPGFSRAFRSPVWGAVASSFIFAAIHPTGIPIWPSLAAIGCMSCALVYQTRSLVPSIVMHAVHNFGTLVLVLLMTR